ncbi:bifunctional metallophosphatase/5'-nucleotidase [Flavihumibacter sp. CACIAM 22H1]|uniref:bifunctional metallophosphatase/5'-nucleotidase n=1 Tax=Flavihumibacter sp. CACIAM 22H1 TaxID=1812911 RepID=UPI0007A85800|nr:bifunctional metallophosphatase/5'-nucleotidase [Flavihumibacter sp. CACIAM 22H1]KYP14551.1 MAG: bifunctional metallophosphatase/5'-nucleotidase [Flavihumibacter sp. CACIAM 22H1]
MPIPSSTPCNCSACSGKDLPQAEKILHLQISENSRRDFLRNAGRLGLGLGIGGGLLASPMALSANNPNEAIDKLNEIDRNKAVLTGKANRFTILHTADIHAQLLVHDEFFIEKGQPVYKKRGGLATLKTMINSLRQQQPATTLVIDGGDCFQGSGVAALTEGRAIVPLMNNIGYDIMLPGNWEVVYGKERMMKDMFAYDGVKVCANMFHATQDELNGDLIFPPYFVKHIGNLKIGFIGYNDPLTPKRQSPAYSNGINFTAPEKNLAKYIRLLKEYEQCDMVFLLTHMGLAQQIGLSNMQAAKGADYILGADTHERVRQPIQGIHAKVTEPGAFGSFLARLDFVVEAGIIKDQSYQLLDVDPEKYPEDPEMKRMIEAARAPYKKILHRVIGQTKTPLVRYYVIETPMDNFITDAIMWKFKPDIALSNGFRFCPPLVPDPKTGKADITMDYLWNMLPVDSEAKRGIITGEQLWNWMEKELHNAFAKDPAKRFGGWVVRFQGMQVNFTIANEQGQRINWIKVGGQPLDKSASYSFVACEREGDPDTTICRVEGVKEPTRLGATLHSVLQEYLALHSPIAPKLEGRCTATDAPNSLLTQLMGYGYEFR